MEKSVPEKIIVVIGQRFGRGVVTEADGVRTDPTPSVRRGRRGARLLCDCGTPYVAGLAQLVSGQRLSCGCLRRELAAQRARQLTRVGHHGKIEPVDVPVFKRLLEDGLSYREIGRQYGVTGNTVKKAVTGETRFLRYRGTVTDDRDETQDAAT
jgi:hypothetical protein